MKTKELGWKETQGIQNIGIENSQGNRIEQNQALKIWENYISELYDRNNRPETLEVEPEQAVDKKGPHIVQSEVGKVLGKWGIRRLQEVMMYLKMCSNYWEQVHFMERKG
jgi:hypothetical protein